ncbi:hypothetical protein [Moumouvirus maliensis]|nr:hypothetical protein [Moumouvirus maliensis]
MNLNKSIKQVNGPINVVRLEGKVNDVRKVIYVFLDFHYGISRQTECENIYSKDIQLYLAENFGNLTKSDKIYDFFLEIKPGWLRDQNYGDNYRSNDSSKDIYIREVVKLFRKIFNYDPTKDLVYISNKMQNVRLHYMDIRDYTQINFQDKLADAEYYVSNMWNDQRINIFEMKNILNIVAEFKTFCKNIINILSKIENNKFEVIKQSTIGTNNKNNLTRQQKNQKTNNDLQYFLNKIFNTYQNQNVRSKMLNQRDILVDYLNSLLTDCNNLTRNYNKILDTYQSSIGKIIKRDILNYYEYGLPTETTREMITTIYNDISRLKDKSGKIFTRFMDLFFLRRFLDKKYITNAVTYTGAYHSLNYIEILLKDFGFKITHKSYSSISDVNELNDAILKRLPGSLGELFYPEVSIQCSDLTNFPDKFL